jgi:hypothetical protein
MTPEIQQMNRRTWLKWLGLAALAAPVTGVSGMAAPAAARGVPVFATGRNWDDMLRYDHRNV